MIKYFDFHKEITSDLVWSNPYNKRPPKYFFRLFIDMSKQSKGIIPYFYGSSTSHQPLDPSDPSVTTVISRGYSYLQVLPLPVSEYPLNTAVFTFFTSSVGSVYSYEVETCLEFIFNDLIKDTEITSRVGESPNVFITATSRGATASAQWSISSSDLFSKYSINVKGMFLNAPISGGSGEGNWYNSQLRARDELAMLNQVNHKSIVTYAKNDKTHANRAITEKVFFFLDNSLVDIVIPENPNLTHTYPSTHKTIFFNMAIDFFEGLQ